MTQSFLILNTYVKVVRSSKSVIPGRVKAVANRYIHRFWESCLQRSRRHKGQTPWLSLQLWESSWHPNRHVVLVTLNTKQREGRKGKGRKEDREEEKGGEEERKEEEDHGSGLCGWWPEPLSNSCCGFEDETIYLYKMMYSWEQLYAST